MKKTAEKPSLDLQRFTAKVFNQGRVSAQELPREIFHIISSECTETSRHVPIRCFSNITIESITLWFAATFFNTL